MVKTKRKSRVIAKRTRKNLVAGAAGVWMGGIVPVLTHHISHRLAPLPWDGEFRAEMLLWAAVAGGLAYSAPTVVGWFGRYVGTPKALGFVLALETAMVCTSGWASAVALATLVGINAFVLAERFAND